MTTVGTKKNCGRTGDVRVVVVVSRKNHHLSAHIANQCLIKSFPASALNSPPENFGPT